MIGLKINYQNLSLFPLRNVASENYNPNWIDPTRTKTESEKQGRFGTNLYGWSIRVRK